MLIQVDRGSEAVRMLEALQEAGMLTLNWDWHVDEDRIITFEVGDLKQASILVRKLKGKVL